MRRGIAGLALLALLLAGGGLLWLGAEKSLGPAEAMLTEAAQAGEDWEKISALTREARAEWEDCRIFSGLLFSQSSVEEIDGIFARLNLWQQRREPGAFASDCLLLAGKLRALADSQSLKPLHLL